jgi:hypothetical protein
MIYLNDWDYFILENHGYNKMSNNISKKIIGLINDNLGKIILNRKITLYEKIGEVNGIIFVNDTINIKLSDKDYGNINPTKIITSKNTIENLVLNLEFTLSETERKLKKLYRNSVEYSIEHESLHIMELYLNKINSDKLSKSWDYGKKLFIINDKYKSNEWNIINYFIYLSLPHEMRARLHQLNSEIRDLNTETTNIDNYIKNTKIYKDVKFISELNTNILISKLKTDKNYNDLIKDFSLIFLENNNLNYEKNFIDYIENIKNKNIKLLDKISKIYYDFESIMYEDFDRVINYDEYIEKEQ